MMGENKLRLSHSGIKTWLHCHKQWWFVYNEKLQTKTRARPLQVGITVHKLIHLSVKGELTQEFIENLGQWVMEEFPDSDPSYAYSIALESFKLVQGYLNHFRGDPLKMIPGETLMEIDMGEFILNGRADCWARTEDDNRFWRVEHKTTSKLDSHYLNGLKGGLQGAIYDYLGEKLFHEDVSGTIYNLLVKTKIPQYKRAYSRINRKSIERMLDTIHGVYRDIQRGDFYPSSSCFNYNSECPFKLLCERDTQENRNAFFTTREEVKPSAEEGEISEE